MCRDRLRSRPVRMNFALLPVFGSEAGFQLFNCDLAQIFIPWHNTKKTMQMG